MVKTESLETVYFKLILENTIAMKRLSILHATLILLGAFANPAAADLIIEFSSAQTVLVPGSGTTTASFDITFSNPGGPAVLLAAYSLFVDIGLAGMALPMGVTFASPDAATYAAGGLLGGSGTINLSPAAGDIGLGQLQFFNSTLEADTSFIMLTIHLDIDHSVASPGDLVISLNSDIESSINAINPIPGDPPLSQTFTGAEGSLTLVAVPEPGAWLLLLAASGVCSGASLMRRPQAF